MSWHFSYHLPLCVALISASELVWLSDAAALNQTTHKVVNEHSARVSHLDEFLKRTIGFKDGIEQSVNGKEAVEWIGEGGVREDDGNVLTGTARFLRHFHDPLLPWGVAGLDLLVRRHRSSIRWMQHPDQQSESRGTRNWSWGDARRYYRSALTAPTPGARDAAWADTLRALGQIMHLIVDASVPEHVRNDPHPLGGIYGSYEYWTEAIHGEPGSEHERAFIRRYLSAPVGFDAAILRKATGDLTAPVPIARLIDTDTYTGTDPNVTLGAAIGIAEFAQANFFSEDTGKPHLFSGPYPFPSIERIQASQHPAPHTGRVRAYYRKGPGDGLPVDPVLAECVLDELAFQARIRPTERCTDENVWAQTAAELLPRAVGYAAGALDYFFRGRLDGSLKVFRVNRQLHARITVTNPSEENLDGMLEIRYDLPNGTRKWLTEVPLALAAGATSEPIETGPLPADAPPTPWTLVFRGRLGLEEGAVIAARVGARYVGPLVYVARDSSVDAADFEHAFPFDDFSDGSTAGPLLVAADTITLHAAVFSNGPAIDLETFRTATVYYRDPTATGDRLELLPALSHSCGGFDEVFYGNGLYRQFNSFVALPSMPAGAQLVEFEPPADLATLFGYTHLDPPVLRRVLLAEIPAGGAPVVDLTGVAFLGVRLTGSVPTPGIPGDLLPDGSPFVTAARGCAIVIPTRLIADPGP